MRAGAHARPADRAEAPKGLAAPPFQFFFVKTYELFEVASKNTLQRFGLFYYLLICLVCLQAIGIHAKFVAPFFEALCILQALSVCQ